MSLDSREQARRILARANKSSGASTAPAPKQGTTTGPGSAAQNFDPTFTTHPGVISAQVFDNLDEGFGSLGLSNPYYLPREGLSSNTIRSLDGEKINFGGFNYLGMASDPRVREAAKAAIDRYGTSASASRIVSGEIPLYGEVERTLARILGVDDALITASGFLTNAATIGYLLGSEDVAVCDALSHSSIIEGTRWAGCRRLTFRHNDPDSLNSILENSRSGFARAMVILEGQYSMDGNIARLPELIDVARKHHCSIMVDEAHSMGVLGATGKGVREEFDLPGDAVDVWMGTLSKSIGSIGGYLAGSHKLIGGLKHLAPGLGMYSTAPEPAAIGAAAMSLRLLEEEPERVARLRSNSTLFKELASAAGFDTGLSEGRAIVPIILGDNAVMTSARMLKAGIIVNAITYPAVPAGQERLRFFVNSEHTKQQIEFTIATLSEITRGETAPAS